MSDTKEVSSSTEDVSKKRYSSSGSESSSISYSSGSSGYLAGSSENTSRMNVPSKGKPVNRNCRVCDESFDWKGGYKFCRKCREFFVKSVYEFAVFACEGDGDCKIDTSSEEWCRFCRLNKCYEAGGEAELVREKFPVSPFRFKASATLNLPECMADDLTGEVKEVYESVKIAKRNIVDWIMNHPDLKEINLAKRQRVVEKCKERGIVVELLLRSLHCHGVLRLYKSFFDPYKCRYRKLRDFSLGMLRIMREMWASKRFYEHTHERIKNSLIFMADAPVVVSESIINEFGESMWNVMNAFYVCEEQLFPLVFETTTL